MVVVAVVKSVVGNVVARDINGNERVLKVGDKLYVGEIVLAGENARAELEYHDTIVTVNALERLSLDEQTTPVETIDAIDSALEDSAITDVLDMLDGNSDLFEDLEAPAAGLEGGSSSSAYHLVQVARIAETFDSITFSAPSNLFVTNDIITSNAFAGDSYSVFGQGGSDNEAGNTTSQDYVAANDAVSNADNAFQNAQDIIDSANSDGLITPAEKETIDQAIKEAEDAKDAAQDLVNSLLENEKSGLQDQLDDLTELEAPEVNDADADGVEDGVQLDAAIAAVEAAEAAYAAADQALANANADGLITPAEVATLEQAKADAQAAKDTAQSLVTALPDTAATTQTGIQDRLDGLTDITIPAVNDADADGVEDTAQVAAAEAAVADAEAAYAAADQALIDANADDLITPAEVADLEQAKADAQAAKDAAQGLVTALPDTAATTQSDLQDRLDGLTDIVIPAVNDADADGVEDTAQLPDADAAVADAETAYADAQPALDDANADGLINPIEHADLVTALADAQAAKDVAQGLVTALPDTAATTQSDLQDRLDGLTDIVIPAVNDADGDGVEDTAQVAAAEAAVADAEAAYAAADQALADANADDLITPAEVADLEQAKADAQAAKDVAQGLVTALPDTAATTQTDLQGRLDGLTDITIPAVNDADADGVEDTAQVAAAEAAVADAEAAYAAADQALIDANADDLITPAEVADLEQAKADAQAAKDAAQSLVTALPDTAADTKADLQDTLNGLTDITIPAVNDADADGVEDTAQVAAAEAAVADAEAAYAAADQALIDANADGLITPAEVATLEQAKADAQAAKDVAQGLVTALPDTAADTKADLQDRLDGLTDITIPAVNDADADGVEDTAQVAAAEAAVADAEAAYAAADQALANANADGLITPAEVTDLEQAKADAQAAKDAAQSLVTALPDTAADTQTDLQGRLDGLTDITIPAVNDADGDGVEDTVQVDTAITAVEAAETAYVDAQTALDDANADGLITTAEVATLEQAKADARSEERR